MEDQGQGQRSAGYFFAGMLMGGLAGAVAAILMAPRSGQEMRDLIQHKGIELRDEASNTAESAAEQVRWKGQQILVTIGEKMGELKERGQMLIDDRLDDLYSVITSEKTGVSGS